MVLDSPSFRASPSQPRVEKLLSIDEEFLSSVMQPVSYWRVLLGVLSSLTPLIPGGCLRLRSLQLLLHRLWDQVDDSTLVWWDFSCRRDLEWWLVQLRLESGISLAQISPDLNFRSDTSDVGWGAHLADEVASGLWSVEEAELSINARDLLAVERDLLQFHHLISGSTVAIFADSSTAMAYLRKQGGTRSPVHNSIAQWILRWAESLQIVLAPQFILGKNNVLADSLSRTNQVQGSEWTLKWEVFQDLHKKWPVMIDLFATSLNHRCSLYFFALPRSEGSGDRCSSSELGRTSGVRLSTLVPDSAGSEETPLVLRSPHDGSGSVLDSAAMVSRPVRSGSGRSSLTSLVSRSRSS